MVDSMEVSPAYGRHYGSAAEVQAGWDSGHDFYSHTHGSYTSNRDMESLGYPTVTVRYGHKNPALATKVYDIQHPEPETEAVEAPAKDRSEARGYAAKMREQLRAEKEADLARRLDPETLERTTAEPTEQAKTARLNSIAHVRAAGPYKKKK